MNLETRVPRLGQHRLLLVLVLLMTGRHAVDLGEEMSELSPFDCGGVDHGTCAPQFTLYIDIVTLFSVDSQPGVCGQGTFLTDFECKPCPAGSFKGEAVHKHSRCYHCPAGHFSEEGASACMPCPPGI